MAGETLALVDSLTKNHYLPGLPNWVNTRRPLSARLMRIVNRNLFRGKKFVFAAYLANPQGTGSIDEGEELPDAGNITALNMELTLKYHYSVARLTMQAIELAATDKGAFKPAVAVHLDGARDQLEEDLAVQMTHGSGHGELARVSSYTSGTGALTLVGTGTNGGWGTRMLRRGMPVQFWTATSGGALSQGHTTITRINSTTTATVGTGLSIAAGDYVFRSREAGVDPRSKVMMGLAGIIDNATRVTTIQNASRSTYPEANAHVLGNSGALRAWTPELMDELCTEASQNGGGGYPTALYSRLEIQRRAAAYLYSDRRLQMEQMQLQGGWTSLAWNVPGKGKVPWIEDLYCRPHEIMAPHEPDLFLAIDKDVQFDEKDGSTWRYTDRTHAVESWLYTWRNLGARTFNNHAVARDVSHTL